MDIKYLLKYVELFHAVIIEIRHDLSMEFTLFPKGSCGSTCLFLGLFLIQNGFGEFQIITGEKYFFNGYFHQEISHSWLECNQSLIIDITAYQFHEIESKVIVTKNSDWHRTWKVVERNNILDIYKTNFILSSDLINYEKIIEKINNKSIILEIS